MDEIAIRPHRGILHYAKNNETGQKSRKDKGEMARGPRGYKGKTHKGQTFSIGQSRGG